MLHQDASACLAAWRSAAARPRGDTGGCDQRDLLGLPGRGRGHRLELSRAGRGDRASTACSAASIPTAAATISSARKAGSRFREHVPTPGRTCAGAARHRAHRRLLARGARPLGASLPHAARPSAEGARLAGITSIERANRWLAETYIAEPQCRASRSPPSSRAAPSSPTPLLPGARSSASRASGRVGNDNTVKWRRLSLQLPASRLRPHFVKAKVRVHEYPDGQLAVFWGPHRLADYNANGTIIQQERLAAWSTASSGRSVPGHAPAQSKTKRTDHALHKPDRLIS